MKRVTTHLILSGIPVLLLGAGCGKKNRGPLPEEPLRPVITITVPETRETVERNFSGLVDSAEGTGIAFEVGGRVVEVIAKEGTPYNQGDVLARLDTTEFENQLDAARAQWTEAQQSYRRAQQLFETGNTPKSRLETAIAAEQAAESNFKSAEKRVSDAVLKMPYPGVIGLVDIEEQMVVNAGQTTMSIQGEGGMEFEIGVPAETVGSLHVGMTSTITLGSLPEDAFTATIDSVSPEVSENTTYPVTLTFDAKDERIREGLDGEAALTIPNPAGATLAIPSACVATAPDAGNFVWVVVGKEEAGQNQTVHQRVVEVGQLRPDASVEILSGLSPGEVVVSRGVQSLEDGQVVTLKNPGAGQ